jgi:hypothetical protein
MKQSFEQGKRKKENMLKQERKKKARNAAVSVF